MAEQENRSNWRRLVALAVCALFVLGALIALRGPEAISAGVAEEAGLWLLSGPSFWHPLTLSAAPSTTAFALAGPRAWQNLHVLVAWLAVLTWFWPLPLRAWRGLDPLVPALLAVVLSGPASGWSGFGLAVLLMSAWRTATFHWSPRLVAPTLPVAVWLAVWLSPGGLLLAAAFTIDAWPRLPRRWALTATALVLAAAQFTPRGLGVWSEANIFVFWSPQSGLSAAAAAAFALLAGLGILALAAANAWRLNSRGTVMAPALLLLAAAFGQTALLWPFALWLIPAWPAAVDQWRQIGFTFRWWMQAAAILAAAGLVVPPALEAAPRWYALAMTPAAIQPTLTRDALPAGGLIYVNPRGLPLARLAGPLPPAVEAGGGQPLGREPSLWRARDRETRFEAVWLLGEKSDYAALARHLGESPDWRLAAVDAAGVLFLRAAQTKEFPTEPAQQMAREMWGGANRSAFLADAALAALAAHALPESGELSAAAVRNSDLSAPAAAVRARTLVSLGEVRAALVESARAVDLDPSLPLAWEVRTEACLHAGLTDQAYAAAQKAVTLAPGETGTLWLAARAANAARAFQTEAELLERLVALTAARGGDAGFYRLYLGQSYAKQGLARPALRELQLAADSPSLTAKQRSELEEEIALIRSSPGAR
jgi:tetratricopeptide (TPR) repeat protein